MTICQEDVVDFGNRPVSGVAAELADVFAHFRTGREFVDGRPYGNGHINDTYVIVATAGGDCRRRYIMQRLNTQVFPRPELVMDNISRMTRHLQDKLSRLSGADPEREALTLVPTVDGGTFLRSLKGDYWRLYLFIEDATSYDTVQNSDQAYQAARAYGRFQIMLSDLPGPVLHETIPDFHHTSKRLRKLERAIGADTVQRLQFCRDDVAYALSLASYATAITDGLAEGALPGGVTHNDTKLNNVMLDNVSGNGVCVIDLDTVMPGSRLYDFGDLVRSAGGGFAENTRDIDTVDLNLDRYRAIVDGYLTGTENLMTTAEREMLPLAAMLMTYEVGIRFLTDYLEGDWYFKTSFRDENRQRARVQLMLVRRMLERFADMRKIGLNSQNKVLAS